MKSKEVTLWRNNRQTSLSSKVRRWGTNPFGAAVRFLEVLCFGQPLSNIFIGNSPKNGNSTGIELIYHLSKSINPKLTNEDLIFLENVQIDMRENFIQLDTGHILNTRKTANELLSGLYWDQVRRIQKSRKPNKTESQIVYPIASQKFFYHFVLEELPEIINIHKLGLVEKFISLDNQPNYVKELLNLADIKVEYIEDEIQNFSKVICPTYSRPNASWAIEQLQTLIGYSPSEFSGPVKVLLLRDRQVRSNFTLEESLKEYLIPRGFEYVDLDLLSNAQQIVLFENAKEIVAIHGGALTNIVFTNKDCRVFEIFSHPYRTYFFREIARIKGNRYLGVESNRALELLKTWLE